MKVNKLLAGLITTLIVALSSSASAQVTQINSQASFSALGSVTQNTNFDSMPNGFTELANPYTIGDLTFSSGNNLVVGTDTVYPNTRPVLAYNFWSPLPGSIAGNHDMFGFNLGYLGTQSDITISLTTSVGSYSFLVTNPSLANNMSFVGFSASAGEKFTGFSLASSLGAGSAPVITDVQLGTIAAAVPEPETYAMLLAGLGLMGAITSRRKAKQV